MSKRMVFTLSPGRCATGYLARMLATIPGVHAEHECTGKPWDFVQAARRARLDPDKARAWLESIKLPAIERAPGDVYVETSHLFGKGFVKPMLDLGVVPDAIIVHRPAREVALSLWRRQSIPARTENGKLYLIHPESPAAKNPVPNHKRLSDYQLCYWYVVEMESWIEEGAGLIEQAGGRVVKVAFDDLVGADGLERIVKVLGLGEPDAALLAQVHGEPFNATPASAADALPFDAQALDVGLDGAERAVLDEIDTARLRPVDDPRPKVDIAVLCKDSVNRQLVFDTLMRAPMMLGHYDLQVFPWWANPTSNTRNQLALEFMQDERCADVLVMIDDDQSPRGNWWRMINKLVTGDADVIGLATPCWKPRTNPEHSIVWNIQLERGDLVFENPGDLPEYADPDLETYIPSARLPDPRELPDGLVDVFSQGTGMILIHRRVLEHPDMRAPFTDIFNADGIRVVGHDLNFCHRAKKLGFKVLASLLTPSSHWKTLDLFEIARVVATAEQRGYERGLEEGDKSA